MTRLAADRVLTMRRVAKSFGAVRALDGVDLDVQAGQVHALVGENGAGKSTLMKVLSGAQQPDAGGMTLGGRPFAPRSPRQARMQGVAMIYQELTIAPHLTVEENIMLGLEHTRLGVVRRRAHRELVQAALARLGHAEIPLQARAGSLSLASQQLVEIARALVCDASVIVFDEPTSVLTEDDARRLFSVIADLAGQGLAIIYISHFLEEVRRVAQRFTVLRDGRTVGTGALPETLLDAIVALMVGRSLTEMFPRVAHAPGENVLELDAVSGDRLPRGASLALRRGEVLGIAGLVGAGRSELLRAVFGLNPVRSGKVRVAGVDQARATPQSRIRQGVGLLSEDRKGEGLALAQSIEDNITYATLGRYARLGWLSPRARRRAAADQMAQLRVRAAGPAQAAGALSGGNQQKVALARLLEQRADVLLLDEPTRGIDIGSKVEVYQIIGALAAQGKGVLMVSSYLPELLGVCDRIAVMRRGEIREVRSAAQWTEHQIMSVATGV